jgi:hypothetical protein
VAVYYQAVLDAIATKPDPTLDKLRKLCEAVDAEDLGQVALQTGAFVKTENPRFPPLTDLPPEVFYETMSRLLVMGAHQDLQLLVEWYERWSSMARGVAGRTTDNLLGMFAFLPTAAPNMTEKDLDRLLARIAKALAFLIPLHAIAAANAPAPTYNPGSLAEGSFGTATGGQPSLLSVLEGGVRALVTTWMAVHQQFLDAAMRQLAGGGATRGEKLLALRQRYLRMLQLTFSSRAFRQSARLSRLPIALARVRYGKSPHHTYLDAFEPFDARTFPFTPYDREPEDEPRGKSLGLYDLLRFRTAQLYFILDSFGEYYPPAEPPKTDAARLEEKRRTQIYAARRKLIDQVQRGAKSLSLVSEDDLVSFGCAFFQAIVATLTSQPGPMARATAFDELSRFLSGYLRTWTVHTEFNLDEEPPYFDLLFPRSINGAVLQDCGVYAVRFAYILLSIAECIKSADDAEQKTTVTFIFLPLHVGLIATIGEFGTTIIHNNMLLRFNAGQAQDWRTEWDSKPEPKDPSAADALTAKFFEDVAAQMFLTDVDLPLFILPVSPVSAPPKKREIWKVYAAGVKQIRHMFADAVSSPGSADFQFDLEFLGVMDFEKRWSDDNVVPFWNEKCFGIWNRKDAQSNRVFTTARLQRNPSLRTRYTDELQKLVDEMDDRYRKEVFEAEKKPLTTRFRARAKAVLGKATTRVTMASRLERNARAIGPVGVVRQHIEEVKKGNIKEPPFANEADFLSRSSD